MKIQNKNKSVHSPSDDLEDENIVLGKRGDDGLDLYNDNFKIINQEVKQNIIHVYLGEQVENNHAYIDLIHRFHVASKDDTFLIHLYNYGGSVATGVQLINALRSSQARTIFSLDAPSYSMGAVLALSGDGLIFNPYTFLMFHNYSTLELGKGAAFLKAVGSHDKWLKDFDRSITFPFLSDKEIKKIEADEDIYIHYNDPDLNKRLKRHFKGAK